MTFDDVLLFAISTANESPCRSKRGVAIWDKKGLIRLAHNHQPAPFICDGSERCKKTCGKTAVHAEQHAILASDPGRLSGASMLHIKTIDRKPVPSGPPSCLECSKLILQAGIAYMWLLHEGGWKWYTAAEFHQRTAETHGIQILHPDWRDCSLLTEVRG